MMILYVIYKNKFVIFDIKMNKNIKILLYK